MKTFISKILTKAGVDKAIIFTVLARLTQASGALISIFLISKFLSKNEQGYYYTFASLIAVQVFFELGLSSVLVQYVAHEKAHLSWVTDTKLEGNKDSLSRLSSLWLFCVKWFSIISIVFFFAIYFAGNYFFSKYNVQLNISWLGPWTILSLSTALNLFVDPILAFTEGLGKVKNVAQLRFIQQFSNLVLLSILLLSGRGLYASPIASLISVSLIICILLVSNYKKIFINLWQQRGEEKVSYKEEIFPYQWRIALSWVSGYFVFQLFNPILFATEGPVIAGQMGMTLSALNGISSLSMSWITTKIPIFSTLIARKNFKELDHIFSSSFKSLLVVNIGLLITFIAFVTCLRYFNIAVGERFLQTKYILALCSVCFGNQIIFSLATYLRCYKKEPFLVHTIVMGVLSVMSITFLGRTFGISGIVYGYTSIILFVGVGWAVNIYITKKSKWQISM